MVIQTADGWILDITQDYGTGDINLLIKLQNNKVISFKQRLKEYALYIQPKSHSAGEDLFQQLSRNDEIIKKIFWANKHIDLADNNKTRLIGINIAINIQSQDHQLFIKKLGMDSRVRSLYNTGLSVIQQFIYNQLKIAPTSKVRIEYEEEKLLSISKSDDSKDVAPPPFMIMHIRIGDDSKNDDEIILNVRLENETPVILNGLSYEGFISCIKETEPDIAVIYEDYQYDHDIASSIDNIITEYCNRTVVIYSYNTVDDISFVELVEKARFCYLPLKFASKYRMLRLIDSRITYELLKRDFVVPKRQSVSRRHEQIRTLNDIVEADKAGMIISPEIGLHEDVAVLDFDNEYANIITEHNISYENLSDDSSIVDKQTALLPSIVQELVERRVYLKYFLKTQQSDSILYSISEARLDILKQVLVCLYGTSGSIWSRYSNVRVFEEINRLARQILLKTKDIVQRAGFELIYADTDAVFLKKKDATRKDYEEIMNELVRETGLEMTLEFHYKFLVLLYIESDEKMEAKKHYFGLTFDNQLVTRGIDTRRHDSPAFIKQFQATLLTKLFDCDSYEDVLTRGYQDALFYLTQTINSLMNGEIQITDLVVSKLLRQNIEKYKAIFPHVAAAIRLNISGVITNRGDSIQYVHTDSNHTDPLQRITPAKLISSESYDKEKYLEMLLDSAEAVLSVFSFNRSQLGFDGKKTKQWWHEIYQQREREIETAKMES